jgi:hypothetical protein
MKKLSPEVRILAGISAVLKGEYDDEEKIWDGSPFAWIKGRPSRQIGAIGEKLVAGWLAARGFNVSRSPTSDADRVIEKKRIEIKFSTLWANGGYKFQQLRDQKYDFVICLGISPFDAHCWVIPKADILRLWKKDGLIQSQHGGAGGSDTAWIAVDPDNQPTWLAAYGGDLSGAIHRVSEVTGFAPKAIREELAEYDDK